MDDNVDLKSVAQAFAEFAKGKGTMKEILAMTKQYNSALGLSKNNVEALAKSLEDQARAAKELSLMSTDIRRNEDEILATARLSENIQESLADIARERAQTEADLLLKQTMQKTGLTGVYAEQAKNLALALKLQAITESQYKQQVAALQKEQKHVQHLKEEVELQEEIANSILEIQEESEAWKKSLTKTFETAKAIGRDPKVFGAFVLGQMVEKVHKVYEGFEELGKSGLTVGQRVDSMAKGFSLMSMVGLSDTKGVLAGMVDSMGTLNSLTSDQVNHVGHLAKEMGISGEEAFQLVEGFSKLPGETMETATHAADYVKSLSEANGVAPGKITKEIAKNTELMALGGYKTSKAFTDAAMKAQKMGVELSTTKKVMTGLLDFENSINKQMEASVLLGREINFDKAAELALMGKSVEATEEVLKQVGGAAELEKMNVKQKEALAAATGLSVEELQKAADAQQEQNKYFGAGASSMSKLLGYTMEYGGAAAGFFKENGLLLLSLMQFLKGTAVAQRLLNVAEAAWSGIKRASNAIWNSSIMLAIRDRVATVAGYIAKGTAAVAEGAWNAVKAAGNFLANTSIVLWIRETAATVGSTVAKRAAAVAEGAWNAIKGVGNFLASTSVGLYIAEKAQLIASTAAKWLNVGATTAQVGTNTTLAATQSTLATTGAAAGGGMAAAGAGLGAFGAAAAPAIPVILALGFALLMASPAIYVLGEVIKVVAQVIGQVLMKAIEMLPIIITAIVDGFVKIFKVLAENWKILIPVGIGLAAIGAGMLALGGAAFFAYPGLLVAAAALALMTPSLLAISLIAQMGGISVLGTGLLMMAAAAPGLGLIALALLGMGAGLAVIATAGFAAMPIIAMLIGLAAVAPALVGIGAALGGMFGGGGGGEKEDKMDILIAEIRSLKAVAASGGTINMDGKKVGEIVRLGLNSGGTR